MASYHKVDRPYLGVANPVLDEMVRGWRREMDLEARVALADALWQSNIHEARVAATKLLTQARIRPDEAVWHLICSWVPSFDGWAVADHACIAGQRRVMADLSRLDEIEGWTTSAHMWTRRAALVITLPLTKLNFPKPDESEARARVLDWAAGYVPDRDWFIQKAVAWWVRDLSKHDADAARAFLEAHGADMKAFARKEAGKYLH
ncbi:3-methyladenine DNA glycosylase AlkD [Antarctobacter heliothermus]|uniref:3-methyladenine DNA glycosylase AlkD n=2 Tax=Antarctobacter heliothermus TaxID=74033 RepID=A0A239D5U1_9RHOB|nr:3-methyladenine DNA glycosylase AlkD [Antarctobacter heliothermus]